MRQIISSKKTRTLLTSYFEEFERQFMAESFVDHFGVLTKSKENGKWKEEMTENFISLKMIRNHDDNDDDDETTF